ncbi:hypothetical protein HK096_002231, partial [Nowakowskiella sp. JEL0078]
MSFTRLTGCSQSGDPSVERGRSLRRKKDFEELKTSSFETLKSLYFTHRLATSAAVSCSSPANHVYSLKKEKEFDFQLISQSHSSKPTEFITNKKISSQCSSEKLFIRQSICVLSPKERERSRSQPPPRRETYNPIFILPNLQIRLKTRHSITDFRLNSTSSLKRAHHSARSPDKLFRSLKRGSISQTTSPKMQREPSQYDSACEIDDEAMSYCNSSSVFSYQEPTSISSVNNSPIEAFVNSTPIKPLQSCSIIQSTQQFQKKIDQNQQQISQSKQSEYQAPPTTKQNKHLSISDNHIQQQHLCQSTEHIQQQNQIPVHIQNLNKELTPKQQLQKQYEQIHQQAQEHIQKPKPTNQRLSRVLEKHVYRASYCKLLEPWRCVSQRVAITNLMLFLLDVHPGVDIIREGENWMRNYTMRTKQKKSEFLNPGRKQGTCRKESKLKNEIKAEPEEKMFTSKKLRKYESLLQFTEVVSRMDQNRRKISPVLSKEELSKMNSTNIDLRKQTSNMGTPRKKKKENDTVRGAFADILRRAA